MNEPKDLEYSSSGDGRIAADIIEVQQLVREVKALEKRAWTMFQPYDHDFESYFSIWQCVNCKAPTCMYRCPLCFWGPEEHSIRAHEASYARASKQGEPMSFERFERTLERYGGHYAAFYFSGNKATVAYEANDQYAQMTIWLIKESANIQHPDLATIWRIVRREKGIAAVIDITETGE